MPEFQLNRPPHRKPPHPFYALDDFAKGYVEAMFFTNGDTGDDDEFILNEMGVERLTKKAVAAIKTDCNAFVSTIMSDGCFCRQWLDREPGDDEQAGRDFWFTRQGHGVGFWDRDDEIWSEAARDALSDVARASSAAYVEIWHGWIHYR